MINDAIGLTVLLLMGLALVNGEARAGAEAHSGPATSTIEVAHDHNRFRHEGE